MLIVLNEVDPETGKSGMQAWTEHTADLYRRIPSDTIYEQYLNGLVDIEWGPDGEFVGTIPIEGEYYSQYDY